MNTKIIKAVMKNKQRGGVALLLFVCLLSCFITPGSAQLLKLKRITALQLGEAVEGSRVTIVSDLALSDYEAFRRGDRFYVKIPLAEFKSVPPRCCANGFEDVQVQKVGDSVVVSFRLQPGATARVDQHSNRLDVIFSAANRTFRNNAAIAASNRAIGTNVSRPSQNRGPDAAGPMPPGAASPYSQRLVTERARAANNSRAPLNPRAQNNPQTNGASVQSTSGNNQPAKGNTQTSTGKNQSNTSNAATQLPSSVPSSSLILTPSTSANSRALTTATPAASVNTQPATTSSGAPGPVNWKTRGKAALQWAFANRLAALLGVLILLSLILYLATALLRRRKKLITAKRANAAKVQPKYGSASDFDELFGSSAVTPPASSNIPKESARKPAKASAAAATPQNQKWVRTKPSVASSSAGHEHSGDEEEREVFEL